MATTTTTTTDSPPQNDAVGPSTSRSDITLRSPSKYSPSNKSTSRPPPIEWLQRTWSVSHSTLSMWRSARNVRITYAPLKSHSGNPPRERVDDLVEYENLNGRGGVKSVAGVDTAVKAGDGSVWVWRGKGLLSLVTSHWEILGWGESTLADGSTERWMVSWFAATMFTKEGLDILTDRREGTSKETVEGVMAKLKGLEATYVSELCEKNMKPVEISLPWKEK